MDAYAYHSRRFGTQRIIFKIDSNDEHWYREETNEQIP